jgi:hypothetical protein
MMLIFDWLQLVGKYILNKEREESLKIMQNSLSDCYSTNQISVNYLIEVAKNFYKKNPKMQRELEEDVL